MTAPARIAALRVGGGVEVWRSLGFEVAADGVTEIGGIRVVLDPDAEGLLEWTLAADAGEGAIDGLPTTWVPPAPRATGLTHLPPVHPNGALAIDHVVAFTPAIERTSAAFAALEAPRRRLRDAGAGMLQGFHRLGDVIVELVEVDRPPRVGEHELPRRGESGPARFWGLVVTVADIGRAAGLIGEHAGPVKDAVQPGRQIVTIRPEATAGLPLALLSPHVGAGAAA